jgi:predicted MFS family arabinose efflux permease
MTIYVIRFFSWGAWSILFSFFAVWMASSASFSAADISLIAGTLALTNRAGSLLFTHWIAIISFKKLMVAMQLLIATAIVILQCLYRLEIHDLIPWMAGVALFGVANSVSTLAQLTFIACGNTRDSQVSAFSMENVALNLSAGVTPYASALVLMHYPQWYLSFSLLYCLPTVVLCLLIRPVSHPVDARKIVPSAGLAASDTYSRLSFLAINFLSFFAFCHFYNVFPFYAETAMGAENIGLLFAASSLLIVLLQLPLTKLCTRLRRQELIIGANVFMAVGVYALFYATNNLSAAVAAVLFLTLAEMIFGPIYQSMSIKIFPVKPAFAMAILTFTWALAETIATVVGLFLVGRGHAWAVFAIAAASALVASAITLGRRSAKPNNLLRQLLFKTP